jgi:hypothetical protein
LQDAKGRHPKHEDKEKNQVSTSIRHTLLSALLAAGAIGSAQAGTLAYQGVTFTSSWTDKVLTLEVDAAHPTGDWAAATTIGALQLKDIGAFDSVTLSAAPGGVGNWTLSSKELNANGCGGGAHAGASLCLSGDHVALSDNMVFKFTFKGGATDFSSPNLKVNLFSGLGGRKVGGMLGENIPLALTQAPAPVPAAQAVPEPQTFAMMFGGLALMGAVRRRRKALGFPPARE